METEKKVFECDRCGKIQESCILFGEPCGWLKILQSDNNKTYSLNFCSHKCAIQHLESQDAVVEDIPF